MSDDKFRQISADSVFKRYKIKELADKVYDFYNKGVLPPKDDADLCLLIMVISSQKMPDKWKKDKKVIREVLKSIKQRDYDIKRKQKDYANKDTETTEGAEIQEHESRMEGDDI